VDTCEKQIRQTPPRHAEPCPRWHENTDFPAKWNDYERDLHTLAIHEAGHAVLALTFGLKLWYASLDRERQTGQLSPYGCKHRAPGDETREPILPPLDLDEEASETEKQFTLNICAMLLAGPAAERIHLGIDIDGYVGGIASDQIEATALLHRTFFHSRHRLWCQERARRLLVMQWVAVLRIAEVLWQGGSIPGVRMLAEYAAGLVDALANGMVVSDWPEMREYIGDLQRHRRQPRIVLYCEHIARTLG
jgi:hypothetical protein